MPFPNIGSGLRGFLDSAPPQTGNLIHPILRPNQKKQRAISAAPPPLLQHVSDHGNSIGLTCAGLLWQQRSCVSCRRAYRVITLACIREFFCTAGVTQGLVMIVSKLARSSPHNHTQHPTKPRRFWRSRSLPQGSRSPSYYHTYSPFRTKTCQTRTDDKRWSYRSPHHAYTRG